MVWSCRSYLESAARVSSALVEGLEVEVRVVKNLFIHH